MEKISALGLKSSDGFSVPQEVFDFLGGIEKLLRTKSSDFKFWDAATTLKELYRKETAMGVTGNEKLITTGRLSKFLRARLK